MKPHCANLIIAGWWLRRCTERSMAISAVSVTWLAKPIRDSADRHRWDAKVAISLLAIF
jgi:hypothetical protein